MLIINKKKTIYQNVKIIIIYWKIIIILFDINIIDLYWY